MPVPNMPALYMLLCHIKKSNWYTIKETKAESYIMPAPNMPPLNMLLFHIKKSNWCAIKWPKLNLRLHQSLYQTCLHWICYYFMYKSQIVTQLNQPTLLKYEFYKKSHREDAPLTSWTLFPPHQKMGEKVFNWSEVHLSEVTSKKIHTLVMY